MLKLDISAYALHKGGTEPLQCEDAHAFDAASGRAAVADGASDSFDAGGWARLLAASYVQAPPKPEPDAFLNWLKFRAKLWKVSLGWDNLPWYAEQKARDVGGLATMLGFSLEDIVTNGDPGSQSARWSAMAIGDACLLHVRGNETLHRFPLEDRQGFNSTPALLCTRFEHNKEVLEAGELRFFGGTCRVGDVFLLATDAVAEWLYGLSELEDMNIGLPDWPRVLSSLEQDFAGLVERLRRDSVMRNDDSTLIIARVVEVEDAGESSDGRVEGRGTEAENR